MGALVLWWVLLEAIGLIGFPLAARLFSARLDHGYAFAKILTVLVVSYVAWLLGSFGVPYATASIGAGLAFVAVNVALALRQKSALVAWLRADGAAAILRADALWTVGFLFFAWQRALAPEIFGAEKYMDFAFFNTLSRTGVLPPEDPWMSGLPFNYYYFGYLMLANLARIAPLPTQVSYNLCVATVGGLAFAQIGAIVWGLTRRLPAALLSGAVLMVIGNLDGFLQFIEKRSFIGFDYWRSSRIVARGDTINEFPYFTAIHGDLHPHYIVMPVVLLMLGLLLDPERFRIRDGRLPLLTRDDAWHLLPLTFVLASMIVISPWELPVGAMVTFLLINRALPLFPLLSWQRIAYGAIVVAMLVVGYVLYAPFYLHFAAPQGGVGAKIARTSLVEFLTVFGALLAPAGFYLAATVRWPASITRQARDLLVAVAGVVLILAVTAGNAVYVLLAVFLLATLAALAQTDDVETRAPLLVLLGACIALLACELVYIKDPYGEKLYRMNTVFKLYFQAWILLSVVVGWCTARLAAPGVLPRSTRTAALGFVAALLAASCAYPIGITATRLYGRFVPATLDGTEYLQREHPDDFAAIDWLRTNVSGLPVILEATGNPYSYYARFSSNTGLPTVMGWGNHEGLWRDHDQSVGGRATDVARMFNAPTLEEIEPLLERYKVRYVIVGELERKEYKPSGLSKFEPWRAVFNRGGTTVYERPGG
ncbi:DUF2298 domain-containing protein [Candidatus Binatia bacterium]|nr:DUF2298 domain-containing protein [Candidatus Binatia bacterium]